MIGTLRLVLTTIVFAVCAIALSLTVLLLAAVRFVISPLPGARRAMTRLLLAVAGSWNDVNRRVLWGRRRAGWAVELPDAMPADAWYVVISNHQAWADIFVIAEICHRRIPFIRWFLKRELMWLPLIGLVWWALDFPFLRRYSRAYLEKHPEKRGEDRRRIRESCARLLRAPATVMVFPEGTRFSPEKRDRRGSPYGRLLTPRVGGLANAVDVLAERQPLIFDLTISYDPAPPRMADLLRGWDGTVSIRADLVPYAELPVAGLAGDAPGFRTALGEWLNARWRAKDARLSGDAGAGGSRPGGRTDQVADRA